VEDAAYLVGAGAGSFGHVGPQPSQFGGSTAAQHRPGAGGRGGGQGTAAPVPGVQGGGDEGGTPRSEGGRGEHRVEPDPVSGVGAAEAAQEPDVPQAGHVGVVPVAAVGPGPRLLGVDSTVEV